MQAVNHENMSNDSPVVLRVSMEFILYAVLIGFVLLIHIADLDIVPMNDVEAVQALPAYHVINPDAPGTPQPATSPITFWLQMISFTLFGGTEWAARFPGVIAGVILPLMPLLFRDRLGKLLTFVLSVVLAASPIAFAAARTTDPAIWTIIAAMALLWTFWRYWESRANRDALWFGGTLAFSIFLVEPGTIILLLIMALAMALTLWWEALRAPEERDTPGDEIITEARTFLSQMPYQGMLLVGVALVFIIATGFMLYPAGLSPVSALIGAALGGFTQAAPQAPPLFGLLAAIVYNPLLLIFAVIGIVWLWFEGEITFLDRFAIVWMGVATIALIVYQGATAADALWLMLPAFWLSARVGEELVLSYVPPSFYRSHDDTTNYDWLKWLLSLFFIGLLIMLNLYLQNIGADLSTIPDGYTLGELFNDSIYNELRVRVIWSVIGVMLIAVSYFLIASTWGNRFAGQVVGLGFFAFMLGTGFGTGWNTVVTNATQGEELWFSTATSNDAPLLRDTLFEIAMRDTRGEPLLNIMIVEDEITGITNDGLLAWLLRDFTNATFVKTVAEAQRSEIVLMPVTVEDLDLGGSYVGQSFTLREQWSPSYLRGMDWLAWYVSRRIPPIGLPLEQTILWLRIDVYDGIPANERIK